jgi:hypothetical protein
LLGQLEAAKAEAKALNAANAANSKKRGDKEV